MKYLIIGAMAFGTLSILLAIAASRIEHEDALKLTDERRRMLIDAEQRAQATA